MQTKIENVLKRILLIITLLMYGFLFVFSFLFSWENSSDLADEHVYRMNDSLLLNIGGAIIVALLIFVIGKCFSRADERKIDIIATCLFGLTTIFCIYWVFASGTAPQADQLKICTAASEMNAGDYSFLQKGGYLAECPHQLGIVTVLRILFAVFGDGNYKSFQVLSALSVFLLLNSGYYIVKDLSGNKVAGGLYVLASITCFPMIFYTAFVYGEIISTAFIMLAFCMLISLFDEFRVYKLVCLFLGLAISVFVRENSLIPAVAILGILIIKTILYRKKTFVYALVVSLFAVFCASVITSALYSSHTPDDANSMPSILYIAMGTNDAGGYSGWYDGSNFDLFEENDCDPELASEAAKAVLADRLNDYKNSPIEAVMFYIRKICAQWSAPMYQSIAMNNNIVDEQSGLAEAIYYNASVKDFLDSFMNIHQLAVFFAMIVWIIKEWNVSVHLEKYVILITIFGGFLFSIIWEAKSRYVFPYYVMMIPLAVIGMMEIYYLLDSGFSRKKSKRI